MPSPRNSRHNIRLVALIAFHAFTQAMPYASLNIGPSIVEVPQHWHDVFPAADFNRDVTQPIWNVTLPAGALSSSLQRDLEALRNASFVVYNQKFYDIIGGSDYMQNKSYETVFTFPSPPAYAQRQIHDATVYSPECDCIFFNQMYSPKESESFTGVDYVWRVSNATSDDQSNVTVEKVYPSPPLPIPNGAYYHNGSIYWSVEGKFDTPGGLVKMDPISLETEVVLNNFYGRRFNSPNDVVITSSGVAFFTDGYYGYENFNSTIKPEMANGIWRWDMNSGDLKQVSGGGTRDPMWNPNGVALSKDQKTLYATSRSKASADFDGQRTIYHFDVASHALSSATLFAFTDTGFPDGVKTDSAGNVYGGVTDSVDVWNSEGTLLGKIKVDPEDVAVNMQFANHWLYYVGRDNLYRVKLRVSNAQSYCSSKEDNH